MANNMIEQPPPGDKSNERGEEIMAETNTLKGELEKEKEKTNDYLNRWKYLQADFENFKKRARKEMDETIRYANNRLITEMLPVIDELECAVKAGKTNIDKAFLDGIDMTLKKLYSILKQEGLSEIETVGKTFDPNKHEAALRVQSEGKDGIILEEIRKGFMLKDIVIRPSLVIVAVDNSKKGEKE